MDRPTRLAEGTMGLGALRGKVALITGACHGVGLEIARFFLSEGASVVATTRKAEQLHVFEASDVVWGVLGDVTVPKDVNRMVDGAIEHFGRVDILVNNAGQFDRFLTVEDVTDETWAEEIAVNLTGPFRMCRRAIPNMIRNGGGVIVNIASLSGLCGSRGGIAYAASKHGLIGLTEHIAATYYRQQIRCLAVCPGMVKPGMRLGGRPSAIGVAATERVSTVRVRRSDPAEMARVVLFAASDAASDLNGTVIVADGGWLPFQAAASLAPF